MSKYMIFGAGFYGEKALKKYGTDNVDYFIDNDPEKQGKTYCDKPIISPSDASKIDGYEIIVASIYAASMIKQLKELGVNKYSVYVEPTHPYYETNELVFNPYDYSKEAETEKAWSDSEKLQLAREAVNLEAEQLYKNQPMFNHIEVETINRCNGSCDFCPVNRKVDPREKAVMSEELFKSIVDQLEEINYSGRFAAFSNDEPLLDERIIELNRYARKHLPNARMHLFTNGTLMTIDKFVALTDILDELIIDNYQQDLKLIKPCQEIAEYCEKHPELKSKVTIVLRKPHEILTSRGGTAPNRKEMPEYLNDRCVLPFKQIIVRPTGKVSLCCNDALGRYTLGDLTKESLLDVWYGEQFKEVRKSLYKGRGNLGNCRYCDTFNMG